jgi:hypothetical protein
MDTDPGAARIRATHGEDLTPIRQLLFEFLSGWLGRPPLYTALFGPRLQFFGAFRLTRFFTAAAELDGCALLETLASSTLTVIPIFFK